VLFVYYVIRVFVEFIASKNGSFRSGSARCWVQMICGICFALQNCDVCTMQELDDEVISSRTHPLIYCSLDVNGDICSSSWLPD